MGMNEIRALQAKRTGYSPMAKISVEEKEEAPKKVKAAAKKKAPKKRTKKLAAIMRQLKKIYPIFLASRQACQIKSQNCTGQATVVHHTKGRGVNEVLDQRTWVASCTACNDFVENKDGWARENGFKISRYAKS